MLEDPDRIGVMVKRRGTWRETVEYYGAHRNLAHQCVAQYDALIDSGWVPAWAALRALDDHCCADIIVADETLPVQAQRTVN